MLLLVSFPFKRCRHLHLPITVLRLAKVGVKKYSSSNLESKIIESTIAQASTEAPLAPNACCAFVLFQISPILQFNSIDFSEMVCVVGNHCQFMRNRGHAN